MELTKVILDYLRLFVPYLTIGVLLLIFISNFKENIAGLIDRIKDIRGPGGLGASFQKDRELRRSNTKREDLPIIEDNVSSPAKGLSPEDMEKRLKSEKQNALFWEFQYLDYYLVYSTRKVLKWLAQQDKGKVSVSAFEYAWSIPIPDTREQSSIRGVLKEYQLIDCSGDNLYFQITPKGRNYVKWLNSNQYFTKTFIKKS